MNNNNKKCSLKKHEEFNAISYCQECKIYMCNKCENHHIELFQNHHQYKLDKDINDIFTGFCIEKNHLELEFYCKNHNKLCCAACISKIKREGKGQHTDCDICNIEDIKEEKKNKLKENIKILENLSNTFEQSINELKIVFEKINDKKEELKLKIQKIFTNIRSKLNEREDQLLLEVDKQFDNIFIKEDIIKNTDKLQNKIKINLEKGKLIGKDWNDNNKLNLLINDCINIENNIEDLKTINENFKKCNNENIEKIKFIPDEENKINEFMEIIKSFGNIYYDNISYKFKQCPIDTKEDLKYEISGENNNIATKTGTDGKTLCIICEKELKKNKIYKWKIKILKSKQYQINVGITTIDFMEKSQGYTNGWYLFCNDFKLCSGPPHNFLGKISNLKKNDEIIIVMDMYKGALKFITNNEDKGDSYTDIPLDKSLFPSITLYNKDDSVEIIKI